MTPASSVPAMPTLPTVTPVFGPGSVNIVFATDQNYLGYLSVCLLSLIEHASPDQQYDICILHDGTLETKDFPWEQLARANVSIRFVALDLTHYPYDLAAHLTGRYTMATYYRFFIGEVFRRYDRILYLDTDIIVLDDVAKLFATPLQDSQILAAGTDRCQFLPDYQGLQQYIVETLAVPSAQYFCCGVLLLDIPACRAAHLLTRSLQKLSVIGQPRLVDQDVINSLFHDRACILPPRWNVMWSVFLYGDQPTRETYRARIGQIGLLHYDSATKPWDHPEKDLAEHWWHYAAKLGLTPSTKTDAAGKPKTSAKKPSPASKKTNKSKSHPRQKLATKTAKSAV